MKRYAAIVLSAGSGSRMKSQIPKQYMELKGYPVIYYSLKAFEESRVDDIILVAGESDIEYCRKEIIEKYHIKKVKAVVPGGRERYDSVYNGIKAAENADYVLIHDGARPMLSNEIIERAMNCVSRCGACVVGMPVKDTIKIVDSNRKATATPDRDSLWQIQTPQCFERNLIMTSYARLYQDIEMHKEVPAITDDAMVVEYGSGQDIELVEGSYTNIKITTPEDIRIAELFITCS